MSAPRLWLGLLGGLATLALAAAVAAAQRGPRLSNGRSIHMTPQGAPPAGRICVAVFQDRDGDGVRDPGEQPLAGRHFLIFGRANIVIAQGSTDAAGDYCSSALPPGVYSVRETAGAAIARTIAMRSRTERIAVGVR